MTLTILLRAPRISLARSRLRLRPHANEQKTGLATKLKEGGPGAADFLASIEVLIVDHADVIAMQNWQHLTTVLDAVNRIPVKRADVDVMRVRESHLEGLARHHRQTIVLSSFASPEINAMARNQCANVAGRARWRVLEYPGVLARSVGAGDSTACATGDQ